MKLKNAGFTVWEVLVVVGIIAILSAVAIPNLVGWRDRARIRGVFENLRGDLQWAKTRAVRDHDWVAVVFDDGRYQINDAAGATMRSRELAAGVEIDMGIPAYTHQDVDFLDAVASGAQVESDVASAYHVQQVIDAIYESARKQGAQVSCRTVQ